MDWSKQAMANPASLKGVQISSRKPLLWPIPCRKTIAGTLPVRFAGSVRMTGIRSSLRVCIEKTTFS